jgi:hypothetical protein
MGRAPAEIAYWRSGIGNASIDPKPVFDRVLQQATFHFDRFRESSASDKDQ